MCDGILRDILRVLCTDPFNYQDFVKFVQSLMMNVMGSPYNHWLAAQDLADFVITEFMNYCDRTLPGARFALGSVEICFLNWQHDALIKVRR